MEGIMTEWTEKSTSIEDGCRFFTMDNLIVNL